MPAGPGQAAGRLGTRSTEPRLRQPRVRATCAESLPAWSVSSVSSVAENYPCCPWLESEPRDELHGPHRPYARDLPERRRVDRGVYRRELNVVENVVGLN